MSEPAWFTAAVDQRIAMLEEAMMGKPKGQFSLAMSMLIEPPETASDLERELWERRCDGCGKDCNNAAFFTGQYAGTLKNGTQFVLVYGVCSTCKLDFKE